MARAVYSYELGDPDFSWLLSTFQESHPGHVMVDASGLPLVLIDCVNVPAPYEQTINPPSYEPVDKDDEELHGKH